jgi:hypothetical protein
MIANKWQTGLSVRPQAEFMLLNRILVRRLVGRNSGRAVRPDWPL